MPRVLRAARVQVAPADEAGYLWLAGELARRFRDRRAHLWVFRRDGGAGEFLEFREAAQGAPLAAEELPADEAGLERRLRRVAAYHDDESRWVEVPLDPPAEE